MKDRDWAAVREQKEAYWRSLTPAERLRLADDLRRQALLLHPDWPTPEQRAADYQAHVERSERLERAWAARKRRALGVARQVLEASASVGTSSAHKPRSCTAARA